jgi:hypothetical protein
MTLSLSDREFIEGGIKHQQSVGKMLTFISLSEPLNARPYRDSGAALTKFIRELNRAVFTGARQKAGLSYVAVGEWGEVSRRFHWHLLVAGVAYPWCRSSSAWVPNVKPGEAVEVLGHSGVAISKRSTVKPLVQRFGFGVGFIGMRQVGLSSGDAGNVSNYLSMYLAKGDAGADLPKGFQLVRASRSAHAWWPGHSLVSVRAAHKERLRSKGSGAWERSEQAAATPSSARETLVLFGGDGEASTL